MPENLSACVRDAPEVAVWEWDQNAGESGRHDPGMLGKNPPPGKLSCLGTAVRAVAWATEPITVVEHHRLVADGTVRHLLARHRTQHIKIQVVVVFVSHRATGPA